jgi:hypothetical protein
MNKSVTFVTFGWRKSFKRPAGASSVCTKLKFYLQQKLNNINVYKLLRLDFLKRGLR